MLLVTVAAGALLEKARDHRCRLAVIKTAIEHEPLRHPVA
jgi:hypothetical protein